MSIKIRRYRPDDRARWDDFVRTSRNGTFLINRGFMEYHSDRFEDHSLLFHDGGGDLIAILPANRGADVLHSHQGLTYGGLVVGARSGSASMLAMFDALREYLVVNGFSAMQYKTIPWIYHRQPAEEDRYALFRHRAALVRRDVLSVLSSSDRLRPQERRRRGAKSASRSGVVVAESLDFASFWKILAANLLARFNVSPVHSLAEIELLRSQFPTCIRLFEARLDQEVVAGAVVFETPRVAHVQYIAASELGKELQALDLLFLTLLEGIYGTVPYFDFGISNEQGGWVLNEGLVSQKEGFGARSVVHDFYEMRV